MQHVTFGDEGWRTLENTYALHLQIVPEDDGGYSAIALNLPGSGSCGDTVEEAIANAKEAVRAVIQSYKDSGELTPWRDSRRDEVCGKSVWVNVQI